MNQISPPSLHPLHWKVGSLYHNNQHSNPSPGTKLYAAHVIHFKLLFIKKDFPYSTPWPLSLKHTHCYRHTNRPTDQYTNRPKDEHTHRQSHQQTNRPTDQHTNITRDEQTNRPTDQQPTGQHTNRDPKLVIHKKVISPTKNQHVATIYIYWIILLLIS